MYGYYGRASLGKGVRRGKSTGQNFKGGGADVARFARGG